NMSRAHPITAQYSFFILYSNLEKVSLRKTARPSKQGPCQLEGHEGIQWFQTVAKIPVGIGGSANARPCKKMHNSLRDLQKARRLAGPSRVNGWPESLAEWFRASTASQPSEARAPQAARSSPRAPRCSRPAGPVRTIHQL